MADGRALAADGRGGGCGGGPPGWIGPFRIPFEPRPPRAALGHRAGLIWAQPGTGVKPERDRPGPGCGARAPLPRQPRSVRAIDAAPRRGTLPKGPARLRGTRHRRRVSRPGAARRNAQAHCDLPLAIGDLVLDEDRRRSCAYFRSPADAQEEAQRQGKAHVARRLLIEPGMRVLGCGWGGLTLARDRAEQAGLSDRVRFRFQGYREAT